jgi:hypothetical protein
VKIRLLSMLFLLLQGSLGGYAQTSDQSKINNTHFFSFAPGLRTNGFGINLKWGSATNPSRFYYYTIDFGKIKHKKEFRYLGNGRYNGFVFGRKNVFMPLHFGIGDYRILGVRNSKNDVGVACTYQAGVSMALLKPVYLYVDEKPGTLNSSEVLVKYNGERNVDLSNILGGAPFFTGINQITMVPGAFGKASLLFSWGKYYRDYHVLELGFLAEAYTRTLPLMANTSNNFIYPSFFINFNMGKFW